MNRKRKLLWGGAALLLAGLTAGGIYLASYGSYQTAVDKLEPGSATASGLSDGEYIGECDVGFIYAQVSVEVAEGQMQAIRLLEHRYGREAALAAEGVIEEMLREQSTDVDDIASATNSSRVIRAAVENALDDTKQ